MPDLFLRFPQIVLGDNNDVMMENDNLYLKIKHSLKMRGSALREMGIYIIEDVYKKELSTAFLDQVRRDLKFFPFLFFRFSITTNVVCLRV